ncbi:hypothetical protein Vretimale_5320, partial [Volvox reticuliferus]
SSEMFTIGSLIIGQQYFSHVTLRLYRTSTIAPPTGILGSARPCKYQDITQHFLLAAQYAPCLAALWKCVQQNPTYLSNSRFESTRVNSKKDKQNGKKEAGNRKDLLTRTDYSGRLRGTPTQRADQEPSQRKVPRHQVPSQKPNTGPAAEKRHSKDTIDRFDPLRKWLARVREDVKLADKQLTPAAAVEKAGPAPVAKPEMTAVEAVPTLLPQQPDDGLRVLGSRPLSSLGGTAPLFDPKMLPEVVRVFHQASMRLRFTTQLPQAVATYVATASQRGTLDLATYDVTFCRDLLLYLGHAQVVNRECLEEVRKALEPRWSQLSPEDLVQVLVALGRLNDTDRIVAVGRSGLGASRLLRMLVDAEPCVIPLLEHEGNSTSTTADAGGSAAAALPSGGALQLALVYLSFYRSATSGHQHFATAIMLQHNLEMCLSRVDPLDPRQAPADELGRLVAGMAGVTLLRSHGLALQLPRFISAIMKRAAELSQPVRALLLDLPMQHWAIPPNWKKNLQSTASAGRKA